MLYKILGIWFCAGLLLMLGGDLAPSQFGGGLFFPVLAFVILGVLRAGWWIFNPPSRRR